MNQLDNKIALVTGGSRGYGRGIVETLAAQGATVYAVARDAERLDQLQREVKGVRTCAADVTDPQTAPRLLQDIRPDILVLNAGAQPEPLPIHEQTWEQFSRAWETDVKATFYFGQQALLQPLKPGSVVVIVSSRAAARPDGSPLSGGYAGAKRTQGFMTHYFQDEAKRANLNIRFVVVLPKLSTQTDLGYAAASAYGAREGISADAYIARFGDPFGPKQVGQGILELLTDKAYQEGIAFTFSDKGLLQPQN